MARNSKESKSAATSVVYARINLRLREVLADAAKAAKISEKEVIERLLEHLDGLSTTEKDDLLKGVPARGFGDLVERLAWAEHAFALKRWTWAQEEFSALAEDAEKFRASGFFRLATYKEAFCWLEIGISCRDAAFQAANPNGLIEAQKAIAQAVKLCKRHNREKAQRVLFFNTACGLALLAQYRVEAACFAYAQEQQGKNGLLPKETDKLWEKLGHSWREHVDTITVEEVSTLATASMRYLADAARDKCPPRDLGFLVDLSRLDKDLVLLRQDLLFGAIFKDWLRTASILAGKMHVQDPLRQLPVLNSQALQALAAE